MGFNGTENNIPRHKSTIVVIFDAPQAMIAIVWHSSVFGSGSRAFIVPTVAGIRRFVTFPVVYDIYNAPGPIVVIYPKYSAGHHGASISVNVIIPGMIILKSGIHRKPYLLQLGKSSLVSVRLHWNPSQNYVPIL